MAFDGFFLKELTKELNEKLKNRRVEKIYQTGKHEIIMSFSKLKKEFLYINASSDNPRIYLTNEKMLRPEEPPMFTMLLRKHLNSAILQKVTQISIDRIIELSFLTRDELGDESEKRLMVEIMGRHSNIILIDNENKVIECIKTVSPFMSKRPMQNGLTYSYDDIIKPKISSVTCTEFMDNIKNEQNISKHLYTTYSGFSPSITNSVLADFDSNNLTQDDLTLLYDKLITIEKTDEHICYHYEHKKNELSSIKLTHLDEFLVDSDTDFNQSTLEYYSNKINTNLLKRETTDLKKHIENIQKKIKTKIKKLENDINDAKNLETYNRFGELLLAYKHTFNKGDKKVTVYDYYENKDIEIELKINKSPAENSDFYYKKYQKAKGTLTLAQEQIEIANEELNYLNRVIFLLEQVESYQEIKEIKDELTSENFLKNKTGKKREKKAKKLGTREFVSPNGFTVRVGRNNIQNDELSLKLSKKNHIWLHTKEIHSAHVVISATREQIKNEDLIFAAELCAYYSKARFSENVPVDYTEIKNVSKPKSARAGSVIYVNYKTVYVNPKTVE